MEKTQIQINRTTLYSLKHLKGTLNISTYDEVIEALVRQFYSGEKVEKISNENLLSTIEKNDRKSLKRIESLHTRIGYFEKDYFLKIQDIFDVIYEIQTDRKTKSNISKNDDKNSSSFDEPSYRRKIEDLEKSHEELESINEELFKKINLIRNNISKKTGVFSSGYEASFSEEEFKFICK